MLAAALAVFAGCQKPSQPAAGVWATVNGKDITSTEVDKYYRTQLNPDAPQPSQDEALSLKLNILDELVNNQILLQRSKKMAPGSGRRRGRGQVHRIQEPLHRGRISAPA